MIAEFKEFVTRGNLVTLAVGFIMGVAFQSVVTSLVDNVVMPIVAIPFGEPNFDSMVLMVNGSEIRWGAFVTTAVGFVLTALAVFLFIVKPYNIWDRRQGQAQEDEAAPSEVDLLAEIRDELRRSAPR